MLGFNNPARWNRLTIIGAAVAIGIISLIIVFGIGRRPQSPGNPHPPPPKHAPYFARSSSLLPYQKNADAFVAEWSSKIVDEAKSTGKVPTIVRRMLESAYWSEVQYKVNEMYVEDKWKDPNESPNKPMDVNGGEAWYIVPQTYACETLTRVGKLFGTLVLLFVDIVFIPLLRWWQVSLQSQQNQTFRVCVLQLWY